MMGTSFLYILKKLLTLVLVALLALNCSAKGYEFMNIVQESLAIGDVSAMSSVFNNTVDITFSDNKATTYSKTQASALLKKFFAKSTAKDFNLRHTGKSHSNNTLYAIGTLYTKSSNYRVYMLFIPDNKNHFLKELRFEKL